MGSNGASGGERALDVIVAGSMPPNPAELIESQTMSEVLSQLTERYDLVVIDTAPGERAEQPGAAVGGSSGSGETASR